MNVSVPSWLTETSLTPYPLVASFGYDSLLIDAQFVQFDNFVPTLKSIKVTSWSLELAIEFDLYTVTFQPSTGSISSIGSTYKLYGDDNRYLGILVFGSGVQRLLDTVTINTTLKVERQFLPHTVRSIPSNCGVFALNNYFGPLEFLHDEFISFESLTPNKIRFNAVAYPPASDEPYLKTLNSNPPIHNSVFLKSTDLIKVSGEASTVELSLVGLTDSGTAKSEAIIVTSDDNA